MDILPASSRLNAVLLSESDNRRFSNEHKDDVSGLVGVVDRPVTLSRSLDREPDL